MVAYTHTPFMVFLCCASEKLSFLYYSDINTCVTLLRSSCNSATIYTYTAPTKTIRLLHRIFLFNMNMVTFTTHTSGILYYCIWLECALFYVQVKSKCKEVLLSCSAHCVFAFGDNHKIQFVNGRNKKLTFCLWWWRQGRRSVCERSQNYNKLR